MFSSCKITTAYSSLECMNKMHLFTCELTHANKLKMTPSHFKCRYYIVIYTYICLKRNSDLDLVVSHDIYPNTETMIQSRITIHVGFT